MIRSRVGWGLAAALLVAVPFVAAALRGDPVARCAADGVALAGAPVVTIFQDGVGCDYCCVGCAVQWLENSAGVPDEIRVTDQSTGRRLSSVDAWFVQSRVIAQVATGDCVHAFESEKAARHHAKAYRGRVLLGLERPFASKEIQ